MAYFRCCWLWSTLLLGVSSISCRVLFDLGSSSACMCGRLVQTVRWDALLCFSFLTTRYFHAVAFMVNSARKSWLGWHVENRSWFPFVWSWHRFYGDLILNSRYRLCKRHGALWLLLFGASRNPDRGRLGIHFSSCVSQAEAVIKLRKKISCQLFGQVDAHWFSLQDAESHPHLKLGRFCWFKSQRFLDRLRFFLHGRLTNMPTSTRVTGKKTEPKAKRQKTDSKTENELAAELADHPAIQEIKMWTDVLAEELKARLFWDRVRVEGIFSPSVPVRLKQLIRCTVSIFNCSVEHGWLNWCQAASSAGPLDSWGGIYSFDLSEYKSQMKASGAYECLVTFDSIDICTFTHRTLPPSIGAGHACIYIYIYIYILFICIYIYREREYSFELLFPYHATVSRI